MWVWTLTWGEVRPDMVIGSCPTRPSDIDRICEGTGATALMSLQTDECRAALGVDHEVLAERASRHGVVLVDAPMRDFDADEQRRRLPQCVRRLSDLLSRGHRTYVHCTAGINRAPLVVLAYLTLVEGMAEGDAMAMIHRGRPEASPSWDAYEGCRQDALAAHRPAIALRAWDLSRGDPGRAPEANWIRAEQQVLAEVFGADVPSVDS